jgi:hypothetical protein
VISVGNAGGIPGKTHRGRRALIDPIDVPVTPGGAGVRLQRDCYDATYSRPAGRRAEPNTRPDEVCASQTKEDYEKRCINAFYYQVSR